MRMHKDGYLEADFVSFNLMGTDLREMANPLVINEAILKRQGQTVGDALKMMLEYKGVTIDEIRNFQLLPDYERDYIEVIIDG